MTPDTFGSVPRPAATLVILRDDPRLKVLVTQRPESLRFMGGALVFPGGAVSEADRDPRWELASDLSGAEASELLSEPDSHLALAHFVCALRESFEEVGFFLGEDAPSDRAADFLSVGMASPHPLQASRLVPAGRWVTPAGAPVRFDARFFLVEAPSDWEPHPDPREVAGCRWLEPAEALAELAAGNSLMAPPTVEMLNRLAHFSSVDKALSSLPQTPADRIMSATLSPLVRLVLAPNPGVMTGPGTNTYVVGPGDGRSMVIDPGVDDDEYINRVIDVAGTVVGIVVTHRHADHTGGVSALTRRTGAPLYAWGPAPINGVEVTTVQETERISVGEVVLTVLHAPGHASDHICLLLEGAASLFAGDCILGEGTAVIAPPDGDMAAYLRTLERLRRLHIDRIYTGHFRQLNGGTRVIEGYIAHRLERERAIELALGVEPRSLEEIVADAYADTAEELHPIAALSARAHLDKLVAERRAVAEGERWRSGIHK